MKLHEIASVLQGLRRPASISPGRPCGSEAVTQIPLAQLSRAGVHLALWVILLSPLVLGERLTRPRLLAADAGFVGI